MVAYLETGEYEYSQAQIDQIVALSGKACDWAKELRGYRDTYVIKKPDGGAIVSLVKEMREWRDAGTGLIRTLAEAQLAAQKASSTTS